MDGCSTTSSKVVHVLPATVCEAGVASLNTANETLNVYPDPAFDKVTIEHAGTGTSIRLYNTLGQQVYNGVALHDIEVMNLSNLPPGLYVLHVTDNNGSAVTKRIVKD